MLILILKQYFSIVHDITHFLFSDTLTYQAIEFLTTGKLKKKLIRKRIENQEIPTFVVYIKGQKIIFFCQIYILHNKSVPELDSKK